MNSAADLFTRLRRRIIAASANDPEPETWFSDEWTAWWTRELERGRQKAELAEAEALTTYCGDPAPIASLGLAAFLDWSKRQADRRRARRAA